MKPYSIRDLRTAFVTDDMRRLGGDYDHESRRWRFASAFAARDAAAIAAQQSIAILRVPEAAASNAIANRLRSHGGFSVMARNDEGASKRGTSTFIFPDQEARFAAQREIRPLTAADAPLRAAARAALDAAPDDLFAPNTPTPRALIERIETGQITNARTLTEIIARSGADRISRPANDSAATADRNRAIETARAFFPTFAPRSAPPHDGQTIVGVLAARTDHTLAILTDANGAGILLERRKIRTPLRLQYPVERSFQAWDPIGVQIDTAGYGDAYQLPRERDLSKEERLDHDLTVGMLKMRALLAAAADGIDSILIFEDFTNREDFDVPLLASDDILGVGIDAGAYAVLAPRSAFKDDPSNGDARLVAGPTHTSLTTSRVRTR